MPTFRKLLKSIIEIFTHYWNTADGVETSEKLKRSKHWSNVELRNLRMRFSRQCLPRDGTCNNRPERPVIICVIFVIRARTLSQKGWISSFLTLRYNSNNNKKKNPARIPVAKITRLRHPHRAPAASVGIAGTPDFFAFPPRHPPNLRARDHCFLLFISPDLCTVFFLSFAPRG